MNRETKYQNSSLLEIQATAECSFWEVAMKEPQESRLWT